MLTERLHTRVYLRAVLLAVRLLLAQLVAYAAQDTFYRVQVALLCLCGNVQLHLRNADRAIVALDHLTIQILFFMRRMKAHNLVRNGQLITNTTLLNRGSALNFVRLESTVRA